MLLLTHPKQGTRKLQEGGNKHEEYDGSKTQADVLHVLYVFDMFKNRIIKTLLNGNNNFFSSCYLGRWQLIFLSRRT